MEIDKVVILVGGNTSLSASINHLGKNSSQWIYCIQPPVCDYIRLGGRLHRKEQEAVLPLTINKSGAEKEIMGGNTAHSHSSLLANNCFVGVKPHLFM